ncbi:hypothetical protein BFX34_15835 [Vibrio cholerae]|nr:hypothetical protein BFX34_15835 [Vibrio cholerae]
MRLGLLESVTQLNSHALQLTLAFFLKNTSFKRNLKCDEMNYLFSAISFFTITAAATIKAMINASSTYPPKRFY